MEKNNNTKKSTKSSSTSKSTDTTLEKDLTTNSTNKTKSTQSAKKPTSASRKVETKPEEPLIEISTTFSRTQKKDGVKTDEVITVKRFTPDLEIGLEDEDVIDRTDAGWNNVNTSVKTKTVGAIIVNNVCTIFNLLIFFIAAWLITVGAFEDLFFVVIVTLNIVIGIVQEVKAKRMIDSLSLLSAPSATVIRNGEKTDITVQSLVLDDVMILSAGKQICSDSIVREGSVEVNESLLTGESDAIIKNVGDTLYSGSFVVSGFCKATVDKVGKDNYIEILTGEAKKYNRPKSELLKSLKIVIRIIGVLIFILGPIYFIQNGGDFTSNSLVKSTAGAIIGMIPSGLFLLTSIALAVGVMRLSRNKTLVQELYCIEILARVNILCLDKTGTITDGTMTVRGLVEYKNETGLTIKQIISAVLNAQEDNNLTSKALTDKFGLGKKIRSLSSIPFSSARKYSAVEFEKLGTILLGAPEFVLKSNYSEVAYDVERNAALGYRVLLLAKGGKIEDNEVVGEVSPLALILIEDTIRPEAVDTIKYFRDNGVSVRVISGDNPLTVSKVSERAGIENASKYISLDGMSDKEIIKVADKYTVFGRVSPNQKKLLIKVLKGQDNTVAMTGDGVNDIPALKEADCSIAMASGSEAARSVSHLVLLDSNFASMPKVVNEGRRVINNIQRVASLFLTKTIFSTLLLLFVIVMNLLKFDASYPISAGQLMMIDFLVIGLPSFILAIESNKTRVKGKFLKNVLRNAIPGALTVVLNALIIMGLSKPLNLSQIAETTTIVIVSTFTCFLVLYKVCRPFNTLRTCLFAVMFTFFILLISFAYDVFKILPYYELSLPNILLMLLLISTSYMFITIFSETKAFVKDKWNKISTKISSIEI